MMLLVATISFLAGMFWGVMLIVLLILRGDMRKDGGNGNTD